MLRVGMDISQIAHTGGVSTYTKNLSSELSRMQDLEMVYFYSSLRKAYKGDLKKVKKFRLPPTLFEMLFNKWRNVSIEKFIGPVDVFHSSDWTQPPTKARKVTTYHDVIPIKYPQWSHPKIVEVHKRRLWLVEQEIDCVIAVSNSTKKDLMEVSQIPEDKIIVIYEGVDKQYKPQSKEKVEEFRKKMKLPEKFILAISGIGDRRNIDRIKYATVTEKLVVLGVDLPYLSWEDLPLLYASAELLLYPSLYEGFGLPIIEAQASGCPVVTSNISSMPEIAGDGAIFVDPYEIEDIANGIKNAKKTREKLIKSGYENARRFTWEKTAQQTADVYKRLKA